MRAVLYVDMLVALLSAIFCVVFTKLSPSPSLSSLSLEYLREYVEIILRNNLYVKDGILVVIFLPHVHENVDIPSKWNNFFYRRGTRRNILK